MMRIDPKVLDTALVRPGTLMFSDLILRIENDADLDLIRRRDLASSLRRAAMAIGQPPETIPADPTWLRARLGKVAPAALSMSAKSWSNTMSGVRAAMAIYGLVERRINRTTDLTPAWLDLWRAVLASNDHSLKKALTRFVYFLSRLDIAPQDVTVEHAFAFRDALNQNEISKCPEVVCRNVVHGWNLAVKRLSAWPRQRLALPTRRRTIKLPLDAFPFDFSVDLERFARSMESPDVFDPDALAAPLRPGTVQQYKRVLVRFASCLVHAGAPIGEIVGLAALVEPDRAERGLRWMLARNGGQTSPSIAEVASLLRTLASRFVRVSEAKQKTLNRLAERLATKKQQGMTPKNRERLRPLQDKSTMRRLLMLPEQLFQQAEADGETQAAVLKREDAISIAMLLTFPIRRQNLAEIHLDKHLQRPADGRVFVVFSPNEVKNSQPIEFELGAKLASMIDRHLATRAPRVYAPASPWLFPRRTGEDHIDKDYLSRRIKSRIQRELGLLVNPHLFRHLAAMLFLDAHPAAYEATKRLLGHSQLSSTLNAYSGFEATTATRLYADVINAARGK